MLLREVAARGYRSLRDVRLRLARCTIVVGANGAGKTNLYRAMELAAAGARGTLGRAIAEEGGMPSVLWAGARKKKEGPFVELSLSWETLAYTIKLGVPHPRGFGFATRFARDPLVMEEKIRFTGERPVTLAERGANSCFLRNADGARIVHAGQLALSESFLSQIADPRTYPELSVVRDELLNVRFYHHFRTDPQAPIRSAQVGTRTPILSHDGADLASAIVTIEEIGDRDAFRAHVALAFPDSSIAVDSSEDGRFAVTLSAPGMNRALHARELSDGTLRYLCLVTALLSPHPPRLLVLNEPETSLHPNLLDALAKPIADATERSQVLVLTHAHAFARKVAELTDAAIVELSREGGATTIVSDP